jgi:NADPH:quinone reductase-like Zn-dependent oxidoreductase
MKAMTREAYGSAGVLELREVDRPVIGDGEVLVRVHAAGAGPEVWHLMTGRPYLMRVMGFGLRRPKQVVLGLDLSGTVEAVDGGVTHFDPGDEVFGSGDGSFAQYAVARGDTLAPKPANLTFEQAAAVPTSGCTALQALRDEGRVSAGQSVLIIGASGGVGTFAVQLAKHFGATVTGVCRTAKADLVRSIGADHVIDYTQEDFADRTRRYDVIVDTAGRRPLSVLRRALTPHGRLVIVGGEGGGLLTGGFERQIVGASLVSRFVSQTMRAVMAKSTREDLLVLKELIEAGRLMPVVSRTFPLADAAQALRDGDEGHGLGKTVITI